MLIQSATTELLGILGNQCLSHWALLFTGFTFHEVPAIAQSLCFSSHPHQEGTACGIIQPTAQPEVWFDLQMQVRLSWAVIQRSLSLIKGKYVV